MSRTAAAAMLAEIARSAREDPARMGAEWVPVLKSVPLFANLPKRHLRRLANLAQPVRFSEHTDVVRAGASGETFYVIIDGEARVVTPGGKNKRA
jgi:hypothetical protein